jgi:hypothetical protein
MRLDLKPPNPIRHGRAEFYSAAQQCAGARLLWDPGFALMQRLRRVASLARWPDARTRLVGRW